MPFLLHSLTCLLLSVLLAGRCAAGEHIQIINANADLKPLPAYLALPSGEGPFPAVVVLHGCSGLNRTAVAWTDQLARWGYVVLAVDSLTARGMKTGCAGGANDQAYDAYRALEFLSSRPDVLADRVGLLGISLGAGATLAAFERAGIERLSARKFRSAVAFYPPCGSSGFMLGPTLVLVGELDDWTPASDCRDMVAGKSSFGVAREPGDRSMIELVVYPDAHHSFLASNDPAGTRYLGHWLQYNKAAADDASDRVRSFFDRTLVR